MDDRSILIPATLRDRLRADTRPQHEALDAAFAALDLTQADGLGLFLGTQHAAMASLTCIDADTAAADRAEVEAMLPGMLAALADDLAALGRPVPAPAPRLAADATAVLYILLGSRLGTQMIARNWRSHAEGRAREAGRYLTLDPHRDAWRAFVARTGTMPAAGAEADRVIADASAIFDHFARTLDAEALHTIPSGPDPTTGEAADARP